MSGSHLSKDFFELVKAIGESKSKQEEDRIIMHEVGVLKRKMPEANVAREKMKEFLVRMIYVEMLGHDASFAYIKVGSSSFGVALGVRPFARARCLRCSCTWRQAIVDCHSSCD